MGGRGLEKEGEEEAGSPTCFGRGSAHFTSHGAPARRHCPSPPEVTSAG